MQATGAVILCVFLVVGCQPSKSKPASPETLAKGGEVYGMACAQCHYDGLSGSMHPALRGSPALMGDPDAVISIILNGQSGLSVVDGKPLHGIMPAQAYLTDEEIASVVTFIRSEFAGISAEVAPAAVGRVRAAAKP